MPVHKKHDTGDDNLDSVWQDKKGGTIIADFVTGDNNTATVESVDSSVPDTPMANGNQGQSKYGCCENILCGYLYDGDLVFVILKGIYGFKFSKRFLEISSRDLTSSLFFPLQLI